MIVCKCKCKKMSAIILSTIEKVKLVLQKYTMDGMVAPIEEQITKLVSGSDEKDLAAIKDVIRKVICDSDIRAFKISYDSALGAVIAKTGMNPEWMINRDDMKCIYNEVMHLIKHLEL